VWYYSQMQNPDYLPYRRRKLRWGLLLLTVFAVLAVLGLALFQIPRINRAVTWRMDLALTYIRMAFSPAGKLPTPAVNVQSGGNGATKTPLPATEIPEPTLTPLFTPTPTLVPTPIPGSVFLTPPAYDEISDKQDLNNCGPATLALYLRYFGWKGNQYDISKVIKPTRDDRNVNVEELVYYVRTQSGWLNAEFRVGGSLDTLKKLIAAGLPVMIEETFKADHAGWPGDDLWAGHYILVTGYDDAAQQFTIQDSEYGPNQKTSYAELDKKWQSFNRVYIMAFPPEMQPALESVLGENWDAETNRQNALKASEQETISDPQNAFAWFNYGTNLTYFERYNEAATAYDSARTIGLPERMLRYQFGPFISYFHSMRTEDLMALTKYALEITRTSEEAMLWRGWGFYRMGSNQEAINYFRAALKIQPEYQDAFYAIDYVTNN
jgi:tetratricopeptide (TPR) repeat protein